MGAAKPRYPMSSYAPQHSEIFCKLTIGATGAVTSFNGYGVASITRNGAGNYTVVLTEQHAFLIGASIIELYATSEDITFQILSEDVDNPTQASRTIVFSCKKAAVETDLTSGALIYMNFRFCDSKKLGFGPTT
jgi:hypothetical protein